MCMYCMWERDIGIGADYVLRIHCNLRLFCIFFIETLCFHALINYFVNYTNVLSLEALFHS